jgi:hypothetical protein
MTSTEPIDLDHFKFEEDVYGDDLFGDEVKHEVPNSFDCPLLNQRFHLKEGRRGKRPLIPPHHIGGIRKTQTLKIKF